jgi:hypothetical protein
MNCDHQILKIMIKTLVLGVFVVLLKQIYLNLSPYLFYPVVISAMVLCIENVICCFKLLKKLY